MWTVLQVFLFTVVAPLVRHVLKALGIGAITYTGLTVATDQLEQMFNNAISGLTADVVGILGIMQVDVAFNMILSPERKITRKRIGLGPKEQAGR